MATKMQTTDTPQRGGSVLVFLFPFVYWCWVDWFIIGILYLVKKSRCT